MSDPLSGAGDRSDADASQLLLRDQHGREVRLPSSVVTTMGLCETDAVILHPHQLYLFVPMVGCARCALLAQYAPPSTPPAQIRERALDDGAPA